MGGLVERRSCLRRDAGPPYKKVGETTDERTGCCHDSDLKSGHGSLCFARGAAVALLDTQFVNTK